MLTQFFLMSVNHPPKNQPKHELKIKINGKNFIRLIQSIIKELIQINTTHTWKHQINNGIIQLNKANAVLSKKRQCAVTKTLNLSCNFRITSNLCFIGLSAKFIISQTTTYSIENISQANVCTNNTLFKISKI